MSESVVFSRRDFLKLVGVGVAGAAAGCAKPPADKLYPYLVAPEDILPGVPYFYASTCRECPVGCGITVRAREGRAIKLEGNPKHPVNQGGLCARGQAGLQGLYDPDRVKSPMVRNGATWKAATWDEALATVAEKLSAAKGKALLLTGLESGSTRALLSDWSAAAGAKHVMWEPFAYESVRAANLRTFGLAAVPRYAFENARCVISFGADFLETFGQPVSQARGFAAMRAKHDDGAGHFIAVEPRLSLTGANADEWVAVKPGTELAFALGLAHVILAENLGAAVGERGALQSAVAAFTPEAVAAQTDVKAEDLTRIAKLFAAAKGRSLAVAGGLATQGANGTALVAAVNLLNYAAGNVGNTVLFDRPLNLDGLATFAEFTALVKQMGEGAFDVAFVHGTNPAYATPAWAGFADAFGKVGFKVSLSGVMDETTALCDVILPSTHALETWGDAQTAKGVWSLQQPAMRPLPMFDARPVGDTLIGLATAASITGGWGATAFDDLQARWKAVHARFGAGRSFEQFWIDSLKDGGVWEPAANTAVRWTGTPSFAAPAAAAGEYTLLVTPSNNFYDGRGANKPWLQELPDMTSKAVWGSWAEVHPETAKKLGVKNGDALVVETGAGKVEVPAYLYSGIRKDAVALSLGQGHTQYGRYAMGRGVNALALVPQGMDEASGALAYQGAGAKLSRGSKAMGLYLQQAEKNQHDREIAQVIPVAALLAGHGEGGAHEGHSLGRLTEKGGILSEEVQNKPGKFTEPLARPEGWKAPAHSISAFEPKEKVRHPKSEPVNVGSYKGAKHRWALAVDLNACNGCAACVVACYAENNIPVVGPELIQKGREMAWIRIDRFEDKLSGGANDVRFLPSMCQHCSDAPCEMVCPVYATYHTSEGLNGQVYNRCVGTRYCSNNCPYKARAFNWFDYSAPEKTTFAFPEPLNWQLNPDVTVRSKGVMEKCTMCIQRILEGKGNARDEKRELHDGEIQTACSQSCPTQAITFGDLMDPASEVARKSYGERKYWVLEELHTRPGVTYLQKIQRETTSEGRA
ncbi:MAG: molybdopterin-dependent oxidoreductase [Candidatus Eisenbacteria bacterium]